MIVKSDDVIAAIKQRNRNHKGEGKGLSEKNPANFLKDFIRKTSCNRYWPERLQKRRITARQRYGNQQVFEFVRYRDGDDIPFPDRYDPIPGIPEVDVESLSLPRAARVLGRADEAWLAQVVVYQRVIQHHLSIFSKLDVVDLSHLQMSVKTQPEIDAMFVATLNSGGDDIRALVSCEAKQFGERILEDQIREQVALAFKLSGDIEGPNRIDAVLPLAIKVVEYPDEPEKKKSRGIYVAEFNLIERSEYEEKYQISLHEMPLVLATRAFYRLHPPVRGISDNHRFDPDILSEEGSEKDGE